MSRRSAATLVALATAAAAAPFVGISTAHAEPGAGPARGSVFVAPEGHAALVRAAQADGADLVRAVGLTSDDAFVVKDVLRDADGTTHVRVERTWKGMPVVGGDMVVERDPSGKVVAHYATFDAPLSLDATPSVTAATAKAKGVAAAKGMEHGAPVTSASAAGSRLVVVAAPDAAPVLAYEVVTTGMRADQTPSRVKAYVDAETGATIRTDEQIKNGSGQGIFVGTVPLSTTATSTGYQLKNPSTGNWTSDLNNISWDLNTSNGPTGTIFTDSDDRWGDGTTYDRASAGVDAQYGADKTFDYFKTVLGRNGIWNTGRGALSRVHYGQSYENAWWDGTQMTYGDGANNAHPLVELDVAGHEMTHGVTENTANLNYSGDAGGLNEATSDIFGTAVEWYANNASDTPDYLVGEEVDLRGNGTPLRWMDQPSKDGRSYDCWSTSVATLDPHYSSGPLNHWFYLASEGSGAKTINGVSYNSPTCNASTVTGAGHGVIEKVWYRALSTKLTSYSTYKNAREAAITSAIELYGDTSQACKSVESAFNAISVPAGTAKCSTGSTPPPTGGNAVTNGGFESGQTGWTGTSGPITNNTGRPAHSGTWKLWLGGNGTAGTEYEQQSVTVPANGKLTYWLRVDSAETTSYSRYDTATVSVNGTTVASYSNLDKSSTWVQKTVDLSSYAGQTVTLKFSATEDSSYQTSFVIDDVAVQ